MSPSKSKRPASGESVLVVDDTPETLEVIERNLAARGLRVTTCASAEQAVKLLATKPVDLVITDFKMPKVDGFQLIRHIRENFRGVGVLMITGYATVDGAVKAMKYGAEDYLTKPFTDEELFASVETALRGIRARRESRGSVTERASFASGFVGDSAALRRVLRDAAKAAKTRTTTLITGESGTGKELVARAIHYQSAYPTAPFVPVNCGGIPPGLLDSELFGYVKGAFTGATESRAGFFQTADGGTIFLDEISETSLEMQVKLLRVLQEKEATMVGSRKPRKIDVRVIAATNKDLAGLVERGLFREDLYYRLNVLSIVLPPLRDRREDIEPLIRHFSQKFALEARRTRVRFSPDAMRALVSYHWPGNVRELQNVVNRLVVMSDAEEVEAPDLPIEMRYCAAGGSGLRSLDAVEAEHLAFVVKSCDGNKTRAAEILGIDRKTLREKLKKHSIS